eukprot:TRINITY_DN7895_c0_g1_i1.p1 TRINITY_DN7895_c0_g1~~TRINITY_DN7895_c0_g1_i1.p1  ORF type:complete len:201 (-),score=28.65 TRINITY_DN7895_c0_g1_i1:91-693(-)
MDAYEQRTSHLISPFSILSINIFNIFNQCVLLTAIQTVMWVGWWNLLAYWAWPWSDTLFVERDTIYIIMGVCLKFVGVMWFPEESPSVESLQEWQDRLPPYFSWKRKIRSYGISLLHFVAFLFAWVGAWNMFDLYLYNCGYCWEREIFYIVIPSVVLFLFQEFMSKESLIWMAAKGDPFRPRYDIESQDLKEESPLFVRS